MASSKVMHMSTGATDAIEISVPAALRFVRVLRLSAAGVLSLREFDVDFVDDVRAAIGEACALVLGEHGAPGMLHLNLRCDDSCVAVVITGRFTGPVEREADDDELSELLLRPLVDVQDVDLRHARVSFEKHRHN